jgi:uncharacterized protein
MTYTHINVRLQPRARTDELIGIHDGVLRARVCAPAVDYRANQALCRLLARQTGIAPSSVTIIRGQRSRNKLIRIDGLDHSALNDALTRRP